MSAAAVAARRRLGEGIGAPRRTSRGFGFTGNSSQKLATSPQKMSACSVISIGPGWIP